MAHVQAALRAAWQAFPGQPARALRIVSDALFKSTTANRYASLVLCEVDLKHGEVIIANGGHPFPLLVGAQQERWLKTGGIPAGMVEGFEYREERFPLACGDGILFVSDGAFEARKEPANGWRQFYACGLRENFSSLRRRLAARPSERALRDDETLLWLKRRQEA